MIHEWLLTALAENANPKYQLSVGHSHQCFNKYYLRKYIKEEMNIKRVIVPKIKMLPGLYKNIYVKQ